MKIKSNLRKLGNSRVTGIHRDAAFVSTTLDEGITSLSPSGAPCVTDDPVGCVVAFTVTDDDHLVVQGVVFFWAGGIAVHSRAEMN